MGRHLAAFDAATSALPTSGADPRTTGKGHVTQLTLYNRLGPRPLSFWSIGLSIWAMRCQALRNQIRRPGKPRFSAWRAPVCRPRR